MDRNVCIFSDGTGQAGRLGAPDNTHVYRLHEACSFPKSDPRHEQQFSFYDPGLGSRGDHARSIYTGNPIYRLVSRATGLGITQNIKECYDVLIQHYRPGSRIFLFGFSRGAYTVRSLGGVLKLCGVPLQDQWGRVLAKDRDARRVAVDRAVEIYKNREEALEPKPDKDWRRRHELAVLFRKDHLVDMAAPYFIGVWDTVRALGLPGSAAIFRNRHEFHDTDLAREVMFARQALAIDEKRKAFDAVPWTREKDTRAEGPKRIVQVWFAGAHSDVGGGYLHRRLGDVSLQWMVDEATRLPMPLIVDREKLDLAPDPLDRHHDQTIENVFWARGDRLIDSMIPVAASVPPRVGVRVIHHRGVPHPYRPANLRGHPDVAHVDHLFDT